MKLGVEAAVVVTAGATAAIAVATAMAAEVTKPLVSAGTVVGPNTGALGGGTEADRLASPFSFAPPRLDRGFNGTEICGEAARPIVVAPSVLRALPSTSVSWTPLPPPHEAAATATNIAIQPLKLAGLVAQTTLSWDPSLRLGQIMLLFTGSFLEASRNKNAFRPTPKYRSR